MYIYLVFHYYDQCVSYSLKSCGDLPWLGLCNLTNITAKNIASRETAMISLMYLLGKVKSLLVLFLPDLSWATYPIINIFSIIHNNSNQAGVYIIESKLLWSYVN